MLLAAARAAAAAAWLGLVSARSPSSYVPRLAFVASPTFVA